MEIDVQELEAQIEKLSPEELKKMLLDAKVRQRVTSKKYYNPETAKKARDKKALVLKAQAEAAKNLPATDGKSANLYEQILSEAAVLADQKLAEEAAEQEVA